LARLSEGKCNSIKKKLETVHLLAQQYVCYQMSAGKLTTILIILGDCDKVEGISGFCQETEYKTIQKKLGKLVIANHLKHV